MGFLLLVTLLIILAPVVYGDRKRPITCSAGTFYKCGSASVTCDFQEDVNATQRGFNIVHYPLNTDAESKAQTGSYVLNCNWKEKQIDCEEAGRFKLSKTQPVSSQVRLDISDVSTSVEGVYVCQLVPDTATPSETCTLFVEDSQKCSCPSLTTFLPPPGQRKEGSTAHMATTLVLVIILLVLVVAGILTVLYIRRNYKLVKRNASATNQVENPQQLTCLPCLGNKNRKPVSDNKVEFEKETSALILPSQDTVSQSVSTENESSDGRLNPQSNVSHSAPANHYKPESTEPRFERKAQQPPDTRFEREAQQPPDTRFERKAQQSPERRFEREAQQSPDTRTAAERSQWSREPRRRQPERWAKEEDVKGEGEEEVFKDAPGTDKPLSEKEKKKLEEKRKKTEAEERKKEEKKKKQEEEARKKEEKSKEKAAEKKRKEEEKANKKSGGKT